MCEYNVMGSKYFFIFFIYEILNHEQGYDAVVSQCLRSSEK